ncbi:unknown [Bacteroides intestinalis CAG:564]|nr:unknown [Bacteroides intestinalis CAG:564]
MLGVNSEIFLLTVSLYCIIIEVLSLYFQIVFLTIAVNKKMSGLMLLLICV